MRRRKFSARTYLLGLISVAVIPIWLFAAYLLTSFALSQQQVYRDQAVALARQAVLTVEGRLQDLSADLKRLGDHIGPGPADTASLAPEARRLIAGTGRNVSLRALDGSLLFETRQQAAGVVPNPRSLTQAELATLRSGREVVSDVWVDPETQQALVDISVPVGDGAAGLVLTMTIPTLAVGDALRRNIPAGWIVGIADRHDVYVTRSERHEEVSGKPGLRQYVESAVGPEGTFTSENQFGDTLLAGYVRSPESGWLYAANVDLTVVQAPLRRSLVGILGIASLALAASLLLAYFVGRSLTSETSRLVSGAIALGSREQVQPLNTGLTEFSLISDALIKAERMLVERTGQLEAVLETAPVAVWFTYDPRGLQVIRNRFAAELMGLSSDDRSHFGVPDHVVETIAFKDGEEVSRENRPLTRAMRGEETINEEFTYVIPSGLERSLLTSARSIVDNSGRIIGAVQISLDITERKRAEEQRQLLAKELNHRVKNNLAIVQALAQQTLRHASGLDEAGKKLAAQLSALAQGHDILTANSWTAGRLHEVVTRSVLSQTEGDRVCVEGEDLTVSSDVVMALTLTLHELTTNAIKYGALSMPSGSVSVAWNSSPARDRIRLSWSESGGPAVSRPGTSGFGTRLIDRTIRSLGGTIEISFDEAGLRVTIELPCCAAHAPSGP